MHRRPMNIFWFKISSLNPYFILVHHIATVHYGCFLLDTSSVRIGNLICEIVIVVNVSNTRDF